MRIVLLLALSLVIGIIWGLYCKISIVLLYLIFYLIYLIFKKENPKNEFKLFSFRRYFRYVKIFFSKRVIKIIIVFSCISNSFILFQNYKYENLYKNLDGKGVELTGIVTLKEEQRYKVKINKGKYKNTHLYLYVNNNVKLEYGDEIKFDGIFKEPKKRSNYKGFDYSNYLKTLKIYGTVNVKNITVQSKNKGNIILKYANKVSDKIKKDIQTSKMGDNEKSLLEGILLGNTYNISKDIKSDFSNSNISYVLAISGMHISFIILISNFIFNKICGKHLSKIIVSIIILLYMCITSFPVSLVRAGITSIILIMSNFFYRKNDVWESLGIALFIIIVNNPYTIQNAGLLLSFAGTIGIISFKNTLDKLIQYYLDKRNRKAIRKNEIIVKKIIKILNSKIFKIIQDAILVTFSANLVVMPIILVTFNKLNITNLIISVITSFIVGEIVIFGLIFVITKITIIQKILSIFLKLQIGLAKFGSKLPLSQIYLVTPNCLEILIYYILIFSTFYIIKINLIKEKSAFQKRIINILNVIKYKIKSNKKKIIMISFMYISIYIFIINIPKNLKIYFVDVGQGDCTVIQTPKNKTILIDGGGTEEEDYNVRRRDFNAIFIR